MLTPDPLPPRLLTELREAPFSYPEVGGTREDPLPAGYQQLRRELVLDSAGGRFERIAEALLTWQVHSGAGLRMRVSSPRVAPETVLTATLALGPFRVQTRCRVVYLIEHDDAVGFAYGTLPGHPERGEERFVIERVGEDSVRFSLTAFSRLASPLARLGGPISRTVQSRVNSRYLATVRSL